MKKRISYLFAAGILISAVTIYSCKKSSSSDDPTLPPIGGYNNSNEVGAANLKAHWAFDGSASESISSTAPTTSLRASFVAGIKGQALKLDSGYVLYPSMAALNLPSFGSATVSAWIFTDNQGNGSRPTGVFALALAGAAQTDWNVGPLNMYLENGRPTTYDDTLVLHSAMATYVSGNRLGGDNINDYGVRETDFKTVHGTNKWVQYILRYDGAGSFLDIYANGVLVSNNNFRYKYTGALPGVGFGPILLPTALSTTQVLIGAFPNSTTGFPASVIQGFQGLYRGNIDELRVFNKALTPAEITALYQLELVGR
jgi:Concanavalin A-like lectin/glucanases superfamily